MSLQAAEPPAGSGALRNVRHGYAQHVRDSLPNATFVAFTGTPVSLEDRDTRSVFGDYLSQDAVECRLAVRKAAERARAHLLALAGPPELRWRLSAIPAWSRDDERAQGLLDELVVYAEAVAPNSARARASPSEGWTAARPVPGSGVG
jgi:SWI2/SNF2 ATPase